MDSVLTLLQKKKNILKEMLRLTETELFTTKPDSIERETERFASLYEKRGKHVSTLKDIQIKLKSLNSDGLINSGEIKLISDECDEYLLKIIEADNKNKQISAKMYENVKKNIKIINQERNMTLLYNVEPAERGGYIIDEKN